MSGRGTGDFWSLGRITAFFAAMTVVSFVVTGLTRLALQGYFFPNPFLLALCAVGAVVFGVAAVRRKRR